MKLRILYGTLILSLVFLVSKHEGRAAILLQQRVDERQAIQVAKADASLAYRDLELYRVEVRETKTKWFVDFKLKNPNLNGGGPVYIISKKTGKILKKTYWQ